MRDFAFALSIGGFVFLVTVIWGDPFIQILRRFGIGDQVRIELQATHSTKTGTPTMGGLLILVSVVLITLALNLVNLLLPDITGRSILLPLAVMVLYGGLGAWDDWLGLRGTVNGVKGLPSRLKFAAQIIIAAGAGLVIMFAFKIHSVAIPGIPFPVDIGFFYVPVAVLWIVGFSNAVNFTDGMDGLAGIISASAFAAYGIIAYLQGQVYLVQFCFAMVGACFAFLWFNAHPAQLFMGDTGSLPLGAALAVVALMTGQWLILPIIAIVPVAEVLSVMIQVSYFKLTKRLYGEGRRILRRSPLHYHFELGGWSETQVVQRFWLVGILASMIGIALALL
jgi:phospho-N-acetylmuramoyl-pentapeptide-transferase